MATTTGHWPRRHTPWPPPSNQTTTRALAPEGVGFTIESLLPLKIVVGAELPVSPSSLADTGNPTQNGNNLQDAITAAALGDVLVLKGGAVYAKAGGFTFPPKGASWDNRRVILRSSRISTLPAGARVSPAQGSSMAQLMTTNAAATLNFSGGRGYRLEGLEITHHLGLIGAAFVPALVDFAGAGGDIELDRVWIHPMETVTAPTAVTRTAGIGLANLACPNVSLTNAYVEGFTGWRSTDRTEIVSKALDIRPPAAGLRVKNNFLQAYTKTINIADSGPAWSAFPYGQITGRTLGDYTHATLNTVKGLRVGDLVLIDTVAGLGGGIVSAINNLTITFGPRAAEPGYTPSWVTHDLTLGGYVRWGAAQVQRLVFQRNIVDSPAVWETWVSPLTGIPLQEDHRHVLLYDGTEILFHGNRFTGRNRGCWGLFAQWQGGPAPQISFVRFVSNLQEGGDMFLSQLSLSNDGGVPTWSGHDLAFLNNLIRPAPHQPEREQGWAIEFGGPVGMIGNGQALTAGHGIVAQHNTMRGYFKNLWPKTGTPACFCDVRDNLSHSGWYWFNTTTPTVDLPDVLVTSNLFTDPSSGRSSFAPWVSPVTNTIVANDAAVGFTNVAAADVIGAPLSGYVLAAGPNKGTGTNGTDRGANIAELQAALDGTDTDWEWPELPRVYIDTTYELPTGGTLYTPATTGAFQSALDTAVPGDVIRLTAGVTYSTATAFRLRNRPGSGWIYITSSAAASLPAPGTRVALADAAYMPRIETTTTEPAIYCDPGAHHYRFVGCDIASVLGSGGQTYWVIDTTGDNTVAGMPHDITFDRCYIHGHPTHGTIRGIRMNGAAIAVVDSWLTDFLDPVSHADTQTLYGIQGGPFKIVNNHLEAAGENLMFGGDDTPIAYMVPHDIEIRSNHFFKPLNWKNGDPSYDTYVGTKNMLELKCAIRVVIEDNLFENFWVEVQGMAVTMTPRSQYGGNPWNRITDVTFRRNTFVNNTGGGLCIQGDDNYQYTQQAARFLIQHNDFGTCGTSSGTAIFQIYKGPNWGGPKHVVIDHNTCLMGRGFLYSDGGGWDTAVDYRTYNFVFTNNILARGPYPMNDGGGIGGSTIQSMFNFWFPGALVRNNLMVDTIADGMGPMPAGNFSVANDAAIGFITDTHYPAPGSIGYLAGTEGVSLGAEVTVTAVAPPEPPEPVPFPAEGILDDTTRANEPAYGTHNGLWGLRSNVQLLSNQMRGIASSRWYAITADPTSSADCEVYVTVAANAAAGGLIALFLRSTGEAYTGTVGSYYYLLLANYTGVSNTYGFAAIVKGVDGVGEAYVGAPLSSAVVPPGAQLGFRATGTVLTGYIDGVAFITGNDAAVPAAGRLTVLGSDSTAAFTAIGGGPS